MLRLGVLLLVVRAAAAATTAAKVIWAPWLNTKWLGNIYEYKSGLFHDPMYANAGPFREGALLFKSRAELEQVALLYQRYERFDESAYAQGDSAYFNLQGKSALRLGRYSIPLEKQVVLTVQRPLSPSKVKSYLGMPPFLKWAANGLLQAGREAAVDVQMLGESDTSFFKRTVLAIEYDAHTDDRGKSASMELSSPDVVFFGEQEKTGLVPRADGVVSIPTAKANSQLFLEALFQALIDQFFFEGVRGGECELLIGGQRDTAMNSLAVELLKRVALGNGLTRINQLDFDDCDPSVFTESGPTSRPTLLVLLTSNKETGGAAGNFGINVLTSSSAGTILQPLQEQQWAALVAPQQIRLKAM